MSRSLLWHRNLVRSPGRRLKLPLFYRTGIWQGNHKALTLSVRKKTLCPRSEDSRKEAREKGPWGGTLGSLVLHQVFSGGAKSPLVSRKYLGFEERGMETVGRLLSAFGSESGPEVWGVPGRSPRRWGKYTTYGAVLGSVHKGALLSFSRGGWAASVETQHRLLQPRRSAEGQGLSPPTLALVEKEPLEGRLWGPCFFPRGGILGSTRTKNAFGDPRARATGLPSLASFGRSLQGRTNAPIWNREKGVPGSFINNETNYPSSSRPFPKDVHGRTFGSATLGSMEILNARKLLQFNKSIFLTLC